MRKHKETTAAPDMPGRPKDWRDQIKADRAAQVETGGTQFPANSATRCKSFRKIGSLQRIRSR